MSGFLNPATWFLFLALLPQSLDGQLTLVLSPAELLPDGTASFQLLLNSSSASPSALQWTFRYSPAAIRSITVDDGPSLLAAGKTVTCAGTSPAYKCLAIGNNSSTIGAGVIAKVTAALTSAGSLPLLQLCAPVAASPGGDSIPISARGCSPRRPVGKPRDH
jgi:hypothetical protein